MRTSFLYILSALVLLLQSCEDPYTPNTVPEDRQIVVEGYIEVGENANPTYVLLTNSIPYISEFGPDKFASLFIKGAQVVVNDGEKDVQLTELCLNELPDALRAEALRVLGLNPDSTAIDICVYVDITDQLTRDYGKKYDLQVKYGNKVLTASTTVPVDVPITNFRWDEPPGEPNDTLARLWVTISDPIGKNYYRFLTDTGEGLKSGFQSTTDDAFFEGKEFEFPLQKSENRDSNSDVNSFGLYMRGDSVTIKWCTLDKEHYDFWTTRDFSANSGGPFSSYTRIKTNVNGGLGIWGGYAVNYYRLYCPPK